MAKGPGFKAVQAKIAAKEGVSAKAAGAILASATRKASPEAKKKNPNLKKVAMPKPKKAKPLMAADMPGVQPRRSFGGRSF